MRRVALIVVPLALGIAMPAHGMTCSTGSAVSNPAANPGLVADCTALLAANQVWGGILDWSTQRPMSQWEGVRLSGSPTRVTLLSLEAQGLSGSIPRELGSLSNLGFLSLGHNELSGSIPRELGNLSNLWSLSLSSNELSGSIPRELGSLSNLRGLSLSSNELSGNIPRELGSLSNLTFLSLSSNELSGSIPRELGSLSNLWSLSLSSNELSGSIPRELGSLSNLWSLSLSSNELSGRVPIELGNLTILRVLYIQDNNLTGCVTDSLQGRLTSYDLGDLSFCDVPGKPAAPNLTHPSGRTLRVTWTAPTNTGPPIIGYQVEYRPAGSSAAYTRKSYGSATRSTRITGLALDTEYEVRVRAENGDDHGPWSDLSLESTGHELVPVRMSRPRVTASGRTLRVVWTAPTNTGPPIIGYDVEYRRRGSVSFNPRSYGGSVRSAAISVGASNTTYEVRVRAKNADGPGGWSQVTEVTTPRARPGKPAAPEVLPGGWGSVRVTWNAPRNSGPSISDYDVQYRKEGSTDAFRDAGFNGTNRETTISRLINGTSYEVQVRARNRDGTGLWSDSGVGTASVAVEYGSETYTATEDGPGVAVTVTLNDDAVEAVTIPITVTPGATAEEGDYSVSGLGSDDSVTFAIGESSKTLTVVANEDADSADEAVELGFGTLPDGVSAGMRPAAVVALADNDPLTVTLSGPSGTVDGPFEVTVTFSEVVVFEAADVRVSGATVEVSGSGAEYAATVTPSGPGTVTVEVAAGAVQDAAGNGNQASQRISVTVPLTCATGSAVPDRATNAGLVSDCRVLLGAKAELDGSGVLNWSADVAMSSWNDVTIDETPRVTEIGVTGAELSGRIPASLGNLAKLSHLYLVHNELSGNIPAELGSLINLESLDVSNNELSGSIPAELGSLINLESLDVSNNELSGSIPAELGSLINLDFLDVSNNELSGSIPAELGDLTNLVLLYLQDNRLSGCVPASLRPGLLAYSLGDLRFCDEGPGKPEAPAVRPAGLSLRVSWSEPVNVGAVSDYDVQYREDGSEGEFTDAGFSGPDRTTTIPRLTPGTNYEVQVRATSADGTSGWSESGVGTTASMTVGYVSRSYTAVEGGNGVPVTVALNVAALETVWIPIEVRAAALTEVGDFALSAQTLTFAVGESSKTLTVTANEDADSADESVELGFGELPATVGTGPTPTAVVALSDNDPLAVTLSGPGGTVDGPFEVTVRFSEEVTEFAADDLTVSGGTVTVSGSGAQYTATVTPSASGTATVEVAAGAVEDSAGNGNQASSRLSVTVQLTCSSGIAVGDAANNAGLVADCQTLLGAKDDLRGTGALNWSADLGMSSWDGLTTKERTTMRVTELRLANRELDGTLPAGLSGLSGLAALDVSNNDVSGEFPSTLGSLSALRELKVQQTRLTGCVPEALRTRLDGALSDLGHLRYCDEGPDKPAPPTVVGEGPGSVVVNWEAPPSGRPIAGYDVQHGVAGGEVSVDAGYPASSRTARIAGLLPGRTYEVQVRATTAQGPGPWSDPGEGETAWLRIDYGAGSYATTEGQAGVTVEVALNEAVLEAVTIPISVRPAALTETNDYTLSAEALTFAVGESRKTLTVTAQEDGDSADESVELGFGELPVGVEAGTTVTAVVALNDDDPLTVTLSGPAGTEDGAFEVPVAFSEEVTGFTADDVTVTGGTVTVSGSGARYTATVTPSASGTVTVEVAAGVVQDSAGNGNEASARLSVTVQLTCSSGVAVTDPAGNPGLVSDCEALLAAKDQLAGTGALNWSADAELSTWDGVTTGGTTVRVTEVRVTEVRLSDRALDGTLPAGLSGLSGLTALDVSSNGVSGSFPSALGSLGALRELKVQRTRLTGCVPASLRARLDGDLSDLGDLRYCDQGPGKPGAPTVRALGSSIVVAAWSAPESRVVITDYDVRYRVMGADSFTDQDHTGMGILATITRVLPGRIYEVQVRATSADGTGPWSESGTARTAALTVSYGAGSYTATEGGNAAHVTVALSTAAAEGVTIPLAVTPASLTEPGDYTLSAQVLTFAAGELSKALTVTANDDADSADESVELSLGELPRGVIPGTTPTATVALNDDDPLTVSLNGPAGTVDAAFEVTVTFSEEVTGFDAADVTVSGGTVTVSGSRAQYTATVTPRGSGTVTAEVAAGAVQDGAGNGNEASAQLSVTVQFGCSSGVAVEDPGNNAGQVSDCEALLAAKAELAGTAALNWSAEVAMSSWDGVRVAGTPRRVTRLELRNRDLDGTVPAALGRLGNLLRLDLGDNRLSGNVPVELRNARTLRRLYLDGNELDGAIPGELGNLTELKRLWLSDNDLSGRVPGELGSLTGLIELYLQGNRLSGCVPSALASIPTGKRDFGELRLCNAGPGRPEAPAVTALGPISLSVSWSAPVATGVTIDGYGVRYREVGAEDFSVAESSGTVTAKTLSGLRSGRNHEVQVRASAGEQSGPWSPSGYGRTETLQVTFGPGPYEAAEGGAAAAVAVALSAAPNEEIRVPIDVQPAGTTEPGDYTASGLSGGELIFTAGQQTARLTVTAREDHDSADETVLLEFGLLPQSVSAGTLRSARVTIEDNDAAPLTVSFGGSAYTAAEGGAQVTIPVRLSQPALREFRVPITATPRGTTATGDYTVSGLTAGALIFAAGSDTRYLRVSAVHDSDAADEAVALGFGAGVPAGPVATAEVTLDDDDTAPLTAAFGAAAYTAVEGATGVAVTVELSQAALAAVSVPITVQGRGTTASGDYAVSGLSEDGAVSFAPGDRARTLTVTAVADQDSADEAVVLVFGGGLPAGATARAVVTLQDDDDGQGVSYGATHYRVAEGGVLTAWVTIQPTPSTAVTIPITANLRGTTAASDFLLVSPLSGELSFPAGVGTLPVVILAQQDADAADETLVLGFGTLPGDLSLGAAASAEVTIVDDESTVTRVSFQAPSVSVDEGGGAAAVTVSLGRLASAALTVPITVTPTGTTASGDYTVSGLSEGSLIIAAGRSTAAFTFTANEDGDAADEAVELGFGALPDGTGAGVQASSRVVLRDNDESVLEVTYGAGSYTAAEGSSAVAVTVSLSQAAQTELAVPITMTPRGTTEAGDYGVNGLAADGTLTFAEGVRSRTLMVSAAEDADAANEAVVLGFGGGMAPAGETAVAVVTLQDNDTTALNVQFGASSYTAVEGGDAASVTVSLNQPAPSEFAIPVTVTPRGTTQPGDYGVTGLDAAGTLAFAVGDQARTLTVTANADADTATEQVVLGFGGVVPPGAIAVAVVSLQEGTASGQSRAGARAATSDLPAISFVASEHAVAEGASAAITVRLSAALEERVTVPITATPKGGTQPDDYALEGLTNGALVFDGGAVEQSFTVRANQDADGRHETMVLGFGTLPERVTVGRPATATVRIEDDEHPVMERITRVNRAVVPHVARATTASVIDAIGSRVAAAGAAGANDAAFDTAGLERLYRAMEARDRDGTLAGTAPLPSVAQVLGDTAFELPVAGAYAGDEAGDQATGPVPTVWGTGDYRSLGGGSGGVAWHGDLFSAHLGFDAPLGDRLLAGVALSWSRGAFEYRDRHQGRSGSGTHRSWTLSAHPYLSWSPVDALGLWATVGYGGGPLEVDDDAADVQSTEMRRLAAAGGLRVTLNDERLLPGGTTSLTARGEGAYTWSDVAERTLIDPLMAQVWRGRVTIEGAHERELPWGSHVRPALEVGVRYDGGEGMDGAGVEVGGGLRYAEPWGLKIEGRGRMLIAHQRGYREWAAGGRVSLDLGRQRQGLSLSVAPSYGQTASGVHRLWESGAAVVSGAGSEAQAGVDADASYGILVAGETLVTPYGGITATEDGRRRYRVGGKLEVGPAFSLDLKGEHAAAPTGIAQQRVSIEGTLRF